MTGPEHYRMAERLLDGIKTPSGAVVVDNGTAEVIAVAHVHATLALTAATALGADLEMPDFAAWRRVASRGQGGGL